MRIVISVLAILFGGLHLIAGLSQSKSQDPAARGFAIAMACGGICVASEAVANLVGSNPGWLDALACATGCLLICAAAYANGNFISLFNHFIIVNGSSCKSEYFLHS